MPNVNHCLDTLNIRSGAKQAQSVYDDFVDDLLSISPDFLLLSLYFRPRFDFAGVAGKDAAICIEALHQLLFLAESILRLDENS